MSQSYAARAISGHDAERAAVRERLLNLALEARWMILPLRWTSAVEQGSPIYLEEAKPTGALESTNVMWKMAKSKAKQSQPGAKSQRSKSFRIRGG